MKVARIIDHNGEFIKGKDDLPLRIDASKLKTKEDAKDYLAKHGGEGASFCCSHGNCKATVHFRKKIEKAAGKSSNARDEAWVSDDVQAHETGCPGPVEYHHDHIPHNGLSLDEAIQKEGEMILFHLNMNLGANAGRAFNRASKTKTKDVIWRETHKDSHSYFPVSTLQELEHAIATIFKNGHKPALERTHISHEGKITALKDFIVRNNAQDRMNILEGGIWPNWLAIPSDTPKPISR